MNKNSYYFKLLKQNDVNRTVDATNTVLYQQLNWRHYVRSFLLNVILFLLKILLYQIKKKNIFGKLQNLLKFKI